MNLYQLNENYQSALENLSVDEATGEVFGMTSLLAIQDDIDQKLLNYGKFIKSLQVEHRAFKDERLRIDKEIKRRDRKIEALKGVITAHLKPEEKLADTQCSLSYRKSAKVNIENEDLVPIEYIEHIEKINKTAIKQALSNHPVPGAALETTTHLQIR